MLGVTEGLGSRYWPEMSQWNRGEGGRGGEQEEARTESPPGCSLYRRSKDADAGSEEIGSDDGCNSREGERKRRRGFATRHGMIHDASKSRLLNGYLRTSTQKGRLNAPAPEDWLQGPDAMITSCWTRISRCQIRYLGVGRLPTTRSEHGGRAGGLAPAALGSLAVALTRSPCLCHHNRNRIPAGSLIGQGSSLEVPKFSLGPRKH